jgi:hypothetical protein
MLNIHDNLLSQVDEKEMWLLLHIAKRIDKDRGAFPSNATLLDETGWSDRTLRKVKKSCVDKGLLAIQKRATESGKQTSNNYEITTNLIGFFIGAKDAQNRGGKKYQGGQELPGTGAVKSTRERVVKSTERSINPSNVLTNNNISLTQSETGKKDFLISQLREDPKINDWPLLLRQPNLEVSKILEMAVEFIEWKSGVGEDNWNSYNDFRKNLYRWLPKKLGYEQSNNNRAKSKLRTIKQRPLTTEERLAEARRKYS